MFESKLERLNCIDRLIHEAANELKDIRKQLDNTQDYNTRMRLFKKESEQEEFIASLWDSREHIERSHQ